jgi:hypothetical protein
MFRTKMRKENQKTNLIFSNVFPKIFAVYEILWKNMVEPSADEMAHAHCMLA